MRIGYCVAGPAVVSAVHKVSVPFAVGLPEENDAFLSAADRYRSGARQAFGLHGAPLASNCQNERDCHKGSCCH